MTILLDSLARDLLDAASAGDIEHVRLLLDAGGDPSYRPSTRYAPALHLAVEGASDEIVAELLLRGCPPDLPDRAGHTALTTAVHELGERPDEATVVRLTAIVELLLEHGASPMVAPGWEQRPLVLANMYGLTELEARLAAFVKPEDYARR